jgi:hypothetical protein
LAELEGEKVAIGGTLTPGGALPETTGWCCIVGWMGRVRPHRFKHSSVPAATLSGIYEPN